MGKACEKCPWIEKGQPHITESVMNAAKAGEWFCCHVRGGTCEGAKLITDRENRVK